ncbi:MAG: AAA family ATPase, partial [Actinobacteria bacterium]|nr:AAA family ATPase [Actinomycetota bacterium]
DTPLTYRELAAKTGWSRGIIGEYFAGHVLPPTDRFDELIRLLGATPAEQGALATARDRVEEHRRDTPSANGGLHLPAALTGLLGRDGEVRTVVALLGGSGSRLVTVTGPGGVGKTRLALAAATQLAPQFADGVGFVSLAAVRDPCLVVATIAEALGLRELGARPLVEILHGYLRPRRVLLVLDNAEHLLAAVPQLAVLLTTAPRLGVLVTSRCPLHLRGEQVYPLAPLDPAAAAELFTQRATQAGTELAEIAPAVVAEICRRLDHLPLAIELAAARTRVLPPATLLARLDPVLSVLGRGGPDLPERQQTLMHQLTGLATTATLRGDPHHAALLYGATDALLEQTGVTIMPVWQEVSDRCQRTATAALGPDAFHTLRHLLDHGATADVAEMCAALWLFWTIRGHRAEGQAWADEALATGTTLPTATRAKLQGVAGWMRYLRGHYDEAAARLAEAARLARDATDLTMLCHTLLQCAHVEIDRGRPHSAGRLLEQAETVSHQLGQASHSPFFVISKARIMAARGQLTDTDLLLTEYAAPLRDQTTSWALAVILNIHGIVTLRLGGYARAEMHQLTGLATTATLRGDPHHAALLYGATDALLEQTGVTIMPVWGEVSDRCQHTATAALGPDAFHTLRHQGRRLPLNEVIALATGEIGQTTLAG